MSHEYYRYNREELLRKPKIPLICMADNSSVFQAMAEEMVEEIEANERAGKRSVFICPVGPVGQYPYLVEMVNRKNISLKHTWFINMDEYLDEEMEWIPADHPLSFRGFMERSVYSRIKPELVMPREQRVFPDPRDTEYIPRLIQRLGGVDMALGGIGINGHVAFNEADPSLTPEEFLNQRTRTLEISPETRTANAIGDFNGALEDMPRFCVTIGMDEIAHAAKIRLGVFRSWHRAVVRRAACGPPSSGFPVSLLQNHPDITVRLTDYVAALEG